MKNKILLASALTTGLATILAAAAILFAQDMQRYVSAAGVLATGAVGLWVIGLASPGKEKSNG